MPDEGYWKNGKWVPSYRGDKAGASFEADDRENRAAAERQQAMKEMGYSGLAGPSKLTREAKAAGKDYKTYEEEKYQEWKKKRKTTAGTQLGALTGTK